MTESPDHVPRDNGNPYVIILREGPSFVPEDVTSACEIFSRQFMGEFWTYGDYELDSAINGFRARVLKQHDPLNRRSVYMQFVSQVRARARELSAKGTGPFVVISSDPFKNGLLGLHVARILGGRFIAEINGAYGNSFAFSHISNPLIRALRLLIFRRVGSYVLKRADGIRLLFDSQLDAFITHRGKAVVRRFYELTHLTRFTRMEEQPLVLLAGFPFLVKGADILVRAFLQIADRYPNWKLVLIGHLLPTHLEQFGCNHPRVLAMPGMLHNELVQWVGRCAIVAQPSRTEAMGRILIEAAAAGKCRIATRVDGIPTVITDGVDGILVEPESVEELAKALDLAMSDPGLRFRLGDAAQARALEEFSAASYLKNYSELIHAVVSSKEGNDKPAQERN